jgi:CheY-like chemotaxis protein
MIVEDEENTALQLQKIITERIEDVHIQIAADVPTARRLIEAARREDEPYHVIILDMMLPPKSGIQAELDVSLCSRIRNVMPLTRVAHITAYDKNDGVKTHLETVHDTDSDRSFSLAKGRGFAARLVNTVGPFLYGLRIEQQINDLFNGGAVMGYPVKRSRPGEASGDRSKTHELAALTRDISAHWPSLDESLKSRIKGIFNITEDGDEVTVSLF